MEITVHGRNAALSEEDRVAAEERMAHAARVFEQAVETIDVEIEEEANPRQGDARYRVEITAFAAGRVVRIEAAAGVIESALDDAVDRLTRQLRRLKERLIDRNRRPEPAPPEPSAESSQEIVRVKQFVMKPMTIEEAILQLEMLGHSFFFFHNAETDRQSVLYRRRDGRLGLIEPA
ncbi:MAG: ribosome hibernation-promoting factor, HPF/YfiA family [Actinomycetota bacterium]